MTCDKDEVKRSWLPSPWQSSYQVGRRGVRNDGVHGSVSVVDWNAHMTHQ